MARSRLALRALRLESHGPRPAAGDECRSSPATARANDAIRARRRPIKVPQVCQDCRAEVARMAELPLTDQVQQLGQAAHGERFEGWNTLPVPTRIIVRDLAAQWLRLHERAIAAS